jgi:hypothetical protein
MKVLIASLRDRASPDTQGAVLDLIIRKKPPA